LNTSERKGLEIDDLRLLLCPGDGRSKFAQASNDAGIPSLQLIYENAISGNVNFTRYLRQGANAQGELNSALFKHHAMYTRQQTKTEACNERMNGVRCVFRKRCVKKRFRRVDIVLPSLKRVKKRVPTAEESF